MHILQVLKKPIVTEKTYKEIARGAYVFRVDRRVKKEEIKKSFEFIFNVKVAKINVLNYKSKKKRLGKYIGKVSPYKKAIIVLKKGEKLDLFKEQEDGKKTSQGKKGVFENFKKSFVDWTTKSIDKKVIESEDKKEK